MIKTLTIIVIVAILVFTLLLWSKKDATGKVGDVNIGKKTYSAVDYAVLKTNLITKVAGRKTTAVSFDDAEDWKAVINYEIQRCKNWTLNDVTESNFIDKLNAKLLLGTC